MIFSSILFLLYFLPLFLLVYHFADRKFKNYVLLAASIFFYAWGAPTFIFILLLSASLNYYVIQWMQSQSDATVRKRWLVVSVVLNVGLLGYFKYANFFIENVNSFFALFGANEIHWTAIVLPIGISFFTFQSITYSVDVYRRESQPASNLPNYLLYILSFPQMIAGPIVQYNTVANEIEHREETADKRLSGFYRFAIGLAKKVLIANVMAQQADLIFNTPIDEISRSAAWIGMIAYTFQIYYDFSGYSDMAIGLGRMLGFTFPENFNVPYISKSITEFWRRWHITLGSFMREYLYIPLGGSRVSKKSRLYFNLIVVFLLSGLWHGASWNFVIWGAYHGLFLVFDRIFLTKWLSNIGNVFSILITFFIVMIGWVIFRTETLADARAYLTRLFFNPETYDAFTLNYSFAWVLAIAAVFSFLPVLRIGKRGLAFFFDKIQFSSGQHIGLTLMTLVLLVLSISSITASGFNPFIYFRF